MYLTHVDIDGNLIFVMVLPFEQKHLAKQAGFVWNSTLPGAWATDNQSTALAAVKANRETVTVAQPTLDSWLAQGKILPETHAAFSERLKTFSPDRKMQAAIEAATMSDDMIAAIHQGLRNIADACDGTLTEDFAGFNRNDVEYGHTLAAKSQLTRSDAGYGKLLLYKYRRQLGEELYAAIFPEVFAREEQAAADKAAKKQQKEADRAAAKQAKQDEADRKRSEKRHAKGLTVCDWQHCPVCSPKDTPEIKAMYEAEKATYAVSSETAATATMSLPEMNEVLAENNLPTITINEAVPTGKVLPVSTADKLAARELEPLQQPYQPGDRPDRANGQCMTCGMNLMPSGYCVACGAYKASQQAKIGTYDPVQNIAQVTKPASVVTVTTDDEVARLAKSLIDCHAGDFDAIVDRLRDLRGIDAPKDGSPDVKEMWQAAGYQTR